MTREFKKISEKAGEPEISIELIDGVRKIIFEKDCLDEVEILRRGDYGEWISIARNISSPYFDEEIMHPHSCIEYKVRTYTNEGKEKGETIFQIRE